MKIYYFNITPLRNKKLFDTKMQDIDRIRVEKIEKFSKTGDKLRCMGAGLLLNYIRHQYHIAGELLTDKFGKPYFSGSDIHFNLSHSGGYVIIAVSEEKIGIDIQRMKQDKHRIAEKNFLPSECRYINEIEDEAVMQQRFCEIWTMKEAYLKNIGIGLRKPLNSFEISFEGRTPQIIGKKEYRFIQLKIDENYMVAICAGVEDKEFQIQEVTL